MDYEKDTRLAYRSSARADAYKRYQSSQWTWGRITTWREQYLIRRLLASRMWNAADAVLDVPCGTGILASTLAPFAPRVLASDISFEMMRLAASAYAIRGFGGFVQADITAMPFSDRCFSVMVTLGFMHRVPADIRHRSLAELHRVCAETAIISFSLTSPMQRLKHLLLSMISSRHVPAPCAISMKEAEREIRQAGFLILKRVAVLPLMSSEWLYVLSKERG